MADADDLDVVGFVEEDDNVGFMAVDAHRRRVLDALARDQRVFGQALEGDVKPADVFIGLADRPALHREVVDLLKIAECRWRETERFSASWILTHAWPSFD